MAASCVFGPVASRRFGRSLGIDVIPLKTCTLNCVYCQLGRTPETTLAMREYVSADQVERDLRAALSTGADFDVATFSGSGEPTLNSALGEMIGRVKRLSGKPVLVLTNGTLLWKPEVREALAGADIVAPTLDATDDETFARISRPAKGLSITRIIDGIAEFSKEFRGELRLEVFLVEGVNDSPGKVGAIAEAALRIKPARIELNTVERPPAEAWAKPVPPERLRELAALFSPRAEVVSPKASSEAPARHRRQASKEEILAYLLRRPASARELAEALSASYEDVEDVCGEMARAGHISFKDGPGGRVYLARPR